MPVWRKGRKMGTEQKSESVPLINTKTVNIYFDEFY